MTEISIADILADDQKNFCHLYDQTSTVDEDDDNDVTIRLTENTYYSESDLATLINDKKYNN